jgi:histidinol-phosphate aminotransferase
MYASFIDHPLESERVIVTRTFSAMYGLAGLRLGYGIASPNLAEQMRAFGTVDSVNTVALQAGIEALADTEAVRTFIKQNADDRQEFFNQAMARMLKPIDSHTNFIMMNANLPAKEVIEHFHQHGIIIAGSFAGMDTYVRVSLGRPSEMKKFWHVWDEMPKAQMRM